MVLVRLKLLERDLDCWASSARRGLHRDDMRTCAMMDCVDIGWTRGADQTDYL